MAKTHTRWKDLIPTKASSGWRCERCIGVIAKGATAYLDPAKSNYLFIAPHQKDMAEGVPVCALCAEKTKPREKPPVEAKPPRQFGRRKTETLTLSDAISEAVSDVELLQEEMQNWEDAANDLSGAQGDLEGLADQVEALPPEVAEAQITVLALKGRPSRSDRAGYYATVLREAAELVRAFEDEKTEDDREELADSLENAADTLEGIMFPGMY